MHPSLLYVWLISLIKIQPKDLDLTSPTLNQTLTLNILNKMLTVILGVNSER